MIKYNNIIERLKEAGYSATRIKEEKLLSEPTMTAIRRNKNITTESIDKICSLLECQPGELMTWYSDEDEGYLLEDNMYIQFVEDDIQDARQSIMRVSRNISDFFDLWRSGKKTKEELDDISDEILKTSLNAVEMIKSAQNNLDKIKKTSKKHFIKMDL